MLQIRRQTWLVYVLFFLIFSTCVFVGFGAAKTREDLLFTFLKNNQVTSGGFKDSNNSTVTQITPFTNFANLYTINLFGQIDEIGDKVQAQNYMKGQFSDAIVEQSLSGIYYSYACLGFLGVVPETNDTDDAEAVIISLRNNDTFSYKGYGHSSESVMMTFFAVEYLSTAGKQVVNETKLVEYIIDCLDPITNAFGGQPGETGNPVDSYYALRILERLQRLNSLNGTQKQNLNTYLSTFYVSNSLFQDHLGGYSYTSDVPYSSLTLTFYCVSGLKILGGGVHTDATIDWVLSRQVPNDYGFQDLNEEEDTKDSSAILSYYAIDTLRQLGGDDYIKDYLQEDIWQLEINPWYVVAIVAGVLGVIAIIIVVVWKIKTRQ